MHTIRDPQFLTTFYRQFCRRPVRAEGRRAVAAFRIDVHDHGAAGLTLSICDAHGSMVDLGWSMNEAWPISYTGVNGALATCDRAALSRCVKRFLLKHQLITRHGQKGIA